MSEKVTPVDLAAHPLEQLDDETDQQYQERLTVQCLEELFKRTQVPSSITGKVWEVIERHGVWAGLAVAKLVIDAFEAGIRWSSKEVLR
jgi:CYTH domain-containing protein